MEIANRASATQALWSVNLSCAGLSRFQSMGGSCGLFFHIPQAVPRGAQTPLERACQPQPPPGLTCFETAGLQGVPGGGHVQLLPHVRPHSQAAGSCSCLLPPALRNGDPVITSSWAMWWLPSLQGPVSFGAGKALST